MRRRATALLQRKTTGRYRLNRGGDRRANNALWRIVLVRMGRDQRTIDYVTRRTAEGMSKPEIMRCLKRYVAREVYTALNDPTTLRALAATYRSFIRR